MHLVKLLSKLVVREKPYSSTAIGVWSVCILTNNQVAPALQGKYVTVQVMPLPSLDMCNASFSCLQVSLLNNIKMLPFFVVFLFSFLTSTCNI